MFNKHCTETKTSDTVFESYREGEFERVTFAISVYELESQ